MEEALPDIYPLTGLQIGDIQSYVSRAFLYFAPLSKKVFILVDNQPWLTSSQSRSARLWQFMVTKYRMSPFANSRTRISEDTPPAATSSSCPSSSSSAGGGAERWFAVADGLTSRALHGFLVFEVAWRDVHGINYLNELLTDTSLALEARHMSKWEFYSADQAAACAHLWFLGRASEARALRGYLAAMQHSTTSGGGGEHLEDRGGALLLRRTWSSSSSLSAVSEDDEEDEAAAAADYPPPGSSSSRSYSESSPSGSGTGSGGTGSGGSGSARASNNGCGGKTTIPPLTPTTFVSPARYSDALLMFRFRDSLLPLKLRQIIMSDIRLLTLLESGLPAWVIFLQSYPVVCHLYRPWMRPLARTLYLLASLATVLIGFYDLYKNVPLLKSAAARICGPLFGWVERWDMVTRIQYLGTILFLRNLRSLLALLRTARALVLAPLARAAGPLVAACGDACELLAAGVLGPAWAMLGPAWALMVDVAEAAWAPFDLVLDHVALCLWPLVKLATLPVRCAAALAGCAGSVISATYDFGKDMWETVSSIFELNHMSEAQQSAFDMSLLKNLWNDLFSQIFRAIRSILYGISVFFASCNRHRLSISNHVQTRLRHMVRVAGLTRPPPSCRCSSNTKRRLGQQNKSEDDDDAVECDACK